MAIRPIARHNIRVTPPKPPSNDQTQRDAPMTPAPGGAATGTDVGRTLIQSPGSQFSAFLAAPQAPDELGRLGAFRILRLIGHGGMGFVFEGEDLKLERRVALKVMRPEVAQHPDAAGRFLREARTAAGLTSDHIVTIHHVDEQNGVPFLVMPLMAGESLYDRLQRGPVSIAEAIRIGHECALGLASAHAAGLIHRDIKPANLWLEAPAGRVKILDFGLARASSGSEITRSGQVLGTPQFMAPEQARGKTVDARADLFSLGAVLYRLTAGREAFSGDDVLAVLTSLAVDDPPPPKRLNAEVPAALSDLIMRLLAKEPTKRPASAAEIAAALQAIHSRAAPTAVLPEAPPLEVRRSRFRKFLYAAPAAMACGAVLAVVARMPSGASSSRPAASTEPVVVAKNAEKPKTEPPPPKADEPAPVVPRPPVLRLLPVPPLTVEAGQSVEFPLTIDRENLPDEVSLSFVAMKGISLDLKRFAPNETRATARLTVSKDHAACTTVVSIAALAGTTNHQQEISLTVRRPPEPKLVVAVPKAIGLKSAVPGPLVVDVRRENLTGVVKLEWTDLPPGVRAGGATVVPVGAEKTQSTLTADYSARGTATVRLRATCGTSVAETPIQISIERVEPPRLDSTKEARTADQASAVQRDWSLYLGKPVVESIDLGGGAKLDLVLIPPGEFLMGSLPDDPDAYPDEQPQHKRRVLKPFYLGRTPVTIELFRAFVRASDYATEAESSGEGGSGLDTKANQLVLRNPKFSWRDNGFEQMGDHPVVNVSHNDALRFCEWLSTRQKVGKAGLPTEAQFEYASRAGSRSRYISGEDDPASMNGFANVSDQALRAKKIKGTERWRFYDFDDDAAFTSPVGHYRGNAFALRDMTGNVWQWCVDTFEGGAYKNPPADDAAHIRPGLKERVVRGGSWNNNSRDTRTATRDRNDADDRQSHLGFRVAIRFD